VAIEKIKSLNKNSNETPIISNQAKLLGQIVNLLELIDRNEIGDMVEILKIAKKHSLSFEDLFPPNHKLSAETSVKLMEAVNKENDAALKNFCLEEIKQRLRPKIELANGGDQAVVDEILDLVKNRDREAFTKLCDEILGFGETVKGCIEEKINKCIGNEANIASWT
jgi:hypothetical protein